VTYGGYYHGATTVFGTLDRGEWHTLTYPLVDGHKELIRPLYYRDWVSRVVMI